MSVQTDEWEKLYQEDRTGWDRGVVSQNLRYWLDNNLLKPCRILVPGCGNGYEVIALAKLGFDVVAIDVATTPIDNLSKLLDENKVEAELVLADFFTWQPNEKFDAIFEQTSLCALAPDRWKSYEEKLYSWLKPEGHLFAQFMQTGEEGGPPYHCELSVMSMLLAKDKWLWSKEHAAQKMESGKIELLYLLEKQ